MRLEKSSKYFGAYVYDVDLSADLTESEVLEIVELFHIWQVLIFPDQHLTPSSLEKLIPYFGNYLKDPYISPIDGFEYVAEVKRTASEQTSIFAPEWHSDWFHLLTPPAATALYAVDIPPVGGDTLFSDQYGAYETLPDELKNIVHEFNGVNSAKHGYSPDGAYGANDIGRSMKLTYSESANATQLHPLSIVHPCTNRRTLYCNKGYTLGIDSMGNGVDTLQQIFEHQQKKEFVYRHKWKKNDLVMWDNRCVLHRASGGYAGHDRLLYRITIG
jgi:taurine dioxygenase